MSFLTIFVKKKDKKGFQQRIDLSKIFTTGQSIGLNDLVCNLFGITPHRACEMHITTRNKPK